MHAVRGAEQVLQEVFMALAVEPSKFERQTNMLRGKFVGLSGSSQEISSSPVLELLDDIGLGSCPPPAALATMSNGLVSSCGAEGSQPMRSARTL